MEEDCFCEISVCRSPQWSEAVQKRPEAWIWHDRCRVLTHFAFLLGGAAF